MNAGSHEIEVVRGEIDHVLEKELRRLWAHTAGLDGEEATQRLREVICVLRPPEGGVAGVNSAFAEPVPLIGGRPFWTYRALLPGRAARHWPAMFNAAFDALAEDFKPSEPGPVGLFAPIHQPELLEGRREAVWDDTDLLYAGYLEDGRQARIRYFDFALI
jgi:hypothetical protein